MGYFLDGKHHRLFSMPNMLKNRKLSCHPLEYAEIRGIIDNERLFLRRFFRSCKIYQKSGKLRDKWIFLIR